MKKALIWTIIILILATGIYYFININNQAYAPGSSEDIIVGGDKDEHGCIGSAGYTWCESKQKCLRVWEEECPPVENTQIANPASVNCVEEGGSLEIKDGPIGQYGICYFEDNRQCEEWALFNGDCPKGGIKITGYDNDAQIYCAITGGEVDMNANTCTFSSGKACGIDEYYNGNCSK